MLNRLRNEGYSAILLEHEALGRGQTMASQGMIHGGIKYTLSGALSGASEAIADMPEYWSRCLRGEGDVDLRGSSVLSEHFYLWSTNTPGSKLSAFFASHALRGRADKLAPADYPTALQHADFLGSVYRLVDIVLDTPDIVRRLADNARAHIYKIDWRQSRIARDKSSGEATLQIVDGDTTCSVRSRALIFAAGLGNEALLSALGAGKPSMQRRPLQQVMVKHPALPTFYGHCLGASTTPRLTISSHRLEDGCAVWYLGGELAEQGVETLPDQLIAQAKAELGKLFPWIDLGDAAWATLAIERAEPRQKNLVRPDQAYAGWVDTCPNVIAAWPVKLTLAPNLGQQVSTLLQARKILQPGSAREDIELPLPQPTIAATPWAEAFT